MNRPSPRDERSKFSGNLRHYHRVGGQPQRTWDEWVDGKGGGARDSSKWIRVVGIIVAGLVLCAIITGLVIELS